MSGSRWMVAVLLVAMYCLSAQQGRAVGAVSALAYSGMVSGYSATWLDWSDGVQDTCPGGWDYDSYAEQYYCSLEEQDTPWVSLTGTLYTPSGTAASSDSTWDWSWAEVDYGVSPWQSGIWTAAGVHYLGYDHWYINCYSATSCGSWYETSPTWSLFAHTSAGASVP